MLQLLITSLIALFVSNPRTVFMWSVLVPLFMVMVMATTVGGRFVPAAAAMVFVCPLVAVIIHMLKVKYTALRAAKKANAPVLESVRNKLKEPE